MRELLVAISFLTRFPVSREAQQPSEETLRRSVMWFPLVGALIGAMTGGLVLLGCNFLPVTVAVGIALAVELRATGALHEDGLADCCDAFGGGWNREDVHRILKDSRLGTYGVAALILGVGLRWMAMIELDERRVFWAIVAAAAVARWIIVLHLAQVPAAPGRNGLADLWKNRESVPLAIATLLLLLCLLPILTLEPVASFAALVLCYLAHLWMSLHVQRRIGGRTGDTLGALAFASQLIVLICLIAH